MRKLKWRLESQQIEIVILILIWMPFEIQR